MAEGFTLAEHMGRTYPSLFTYKCETCNGAGTMTCPHCQGYKVQMATAHNGFRLSQSTAVGKYVSLSRDDQVDACVSLMLDSSSRI